MSLEQLSVAVLAGLSESLDTEVARSWGRHAVPIDDFRANRSPIEYLAPPLLVTTGPHDKPGSLDALCTQGATISIAVLGALTTPAATSLEDSLKALERVIHSDLAFLLQSLSTLISHMLSRHHGRLVLVTWDPDSQRDPERSISQCVSVGAVTYLESLRPALRRRGVDAKLLLLSCRSTGELSSGTNLRLVATAIQECLHSQRSVHKLRIN